jgi:hypothetical protein
MEAQGMAMAFGRCSCGDKMKSLDRREEDMCGLAGRVATAGHGAG